MDDNTVLFMFKLAKLFKEHNASLSGCGCCGSPLLQVGFDAVDTFETHSGKFSYRDPVEDLVENRHKSSDDILIPEED